jgi:hypothetical protein
VAHAHAAAGYTVPQQFMDLFFDFSGSEEPDYPLGQPTLGQMLTQTEIAKRAAEPSGALVMMFGSDIDVYDANNGALLEHQQFRADRTNGFFEMTAISHIGPALAYLARIKANGDARWKPRLASLQTHIAQVPMLNARATDHWLDQLNRPAWNPHKAQIRAMIDYACACSFDYIGALGSGDAFTVTGVNDDFFQATSARFPIPFNNVMVATFMLDALQGAADVHAALDPLKLDWARAMVLVSSRAGANVSSWLTEGTNWLVYFLQAVSGFTLPGERIKIVPYAGVSFYPPVRSL